MSNCNDIHRYSYTCIIVFKLTTFYKIYKCILFKISDYVIKNIEILADRVCCFDRTNGLCFSARVQKL